MALNGMIRMALNQSGGGRGVTVRPGGVEYQPATPFDKILAAAAQNLQPAGPDLTAVPDRFASGPSPQIRGQAMPVYPTYDESVSTGDRIAQILATAAPIIEAAIGHPGAPGKPYVHDWAGAVPAAAAGYLGGREAITKTAQEEYARNVGAWKGQMEQAQLGAAQEQNALWGRMLGQPVGPSGAIVTGKDRASQPPPAYSPTPGGAIVNKFTGATTPGGPGVARPVNDSNVPYSTGDAIHIPDAWDANGNPTHWRVEKINQAPGTAGQPHVVHYPGGMGVLKIGADGQPYVEELVGTNPAAGKDSPYARSFIADVERIRAQGRADPHVDVEGSIRQLYNDYKTWHPDMPPVDSLVTQPAPTVKGGNPFAQFGPPQGAQ